ncbi:ABC transporter permease [Symbiobacterium thermophilum]|nr:ABC transporter permease [Symbiobacterium thermophilum]MBY6274717.1 ABC transporter permease [Symbiobacterium thermophilum]
MRMVALAQAQLQDVIRNPLLVLFAALLPAMGIMMRLVMPESARPLLVVMLSVMAPYFVGWNVAGITLAEEKEKRRLEALFLTPVRPWQVVMVKGALALAGTLVMGAVMLAVGGKVPVRPGIWFLAYLLLTLFAVGAGTLLGLLFKDMRSMSIGGTPVQILLLFATTLPWALAGPVLWEVQAWLPTRPVVDLMQAGFFGEEVPVLRHALVMLGYVAAVWLANVSLVRRLSFLVR